MTDPTPAPQAKPATGILARAQAKTTERSKPRDARDEWIRKQIRDEVAELLTGSPFDVDSYLQNAFREIEKSKLLLQAARQSPPTVLGGIMLGATLQLPIGGPLGQFYLTPRYEGQGNKKRAMCVPMIGYRGFFELGYRSGMIRAFDYIVRREGDVFKQAANSERGKFFDWEQYQDGEFDELDENGNRRPLTGVVALAMPLASSKPSFQFMSKATIEKRRPRTTANTPWEGEHREAMYVKTPHRELAKFLQLSIASAKAVEADEMISEWNKTTGALETLETAEGRVYEDAEVIAEAEIVPDADDDRRTEDSSAPESVSTPEPSKAANGRVADDDTSNVDALDLPQYTREQGRQMTDAEFERYSAAGGQ